MDIEFKRFDLTVDPCPPMVLRNLIAKGFPPTAVRDDGTLDPTVAADFGWTVRGGWVAPPGDVAHPA